MFLNAILSNAIPLQIPGTEAYLAPDIVEIRIYVGVATVLGGIFTFIGLQFLNNLTKRLDRMDEKLEITLARQSAMLERQQHIPTKSEVISMIRDENEFRSK